MTQEVFREIERQEELAKQRKFLRDQGIKYSGMTKNDWIDVAERLFRENIKLKGKKNAKR